VPHPSVIFLIALLIAGPVAAQQKFEPADYQKALVSGQIVEYAAAMEDLARRAQLAENWPDASSAYERAATAFLRLRQLPKAMSHASAAVELALKSNSPSIELTAMMRLADVFGRVRQLQKEWEWLEKARAVVESMEPGVNRNNREGRLNMQSCPTWPRISPSWKSRRSYRIVHAWDRCCACRQVRNRYGGKSFGQFRLGLSPAERF